MNQRIVKNGESLPLMAPSRLNAAVARYQGEPSLPPLDPEGAAARYQGEPSLPLHSRLNRAVARYQGEPSLPPLDAEGAAAPFLTFSEVFGALLRRKWILTGLVAAGAVAGLTIAYSQRPVYQAKALIEIQGVNENFLNRRELDPTSGDGGAMLEPYIQTQVKLLQTARLLGRVADKLDLDTLPEFHPKPGILRQIKERLGLSARGAGEDARQALLAAVARNLTVRLSGETHLVEVAYESTDARTAAAVANTLADEYVAQNLEKRLSATEYTGKWLSGQLQDLKTTLDRSERELEDYVKSHGLLASPDASKTNIEDGRLRQLEAAYQTARESRIDDQSRYEMVAGAPLERLSDAIDSETVRLYQTKLTDLKQKLAEARAVYTPAHYKVREIQVQIDEVQQALEHERQSLVNRLRNQFAASTQREKLLETDLVQATGQVTQETADAVRYNRLKRTVDTYSRLYDGTIEKVKETDLASAVRANNVQVAETAVPPAAPVRPSKPLYGALGTLCGLLLGVVLGLDRDRRNRLVSAPGDCAARLGIPEFGPIPCASLELPFSVKSYVAVPARIAAYGAAEPGAEEDGILRNWLEVVTWRQRGSQLAESYRSTLASLMNSADNNPPRVIVFSSAGAGEGKTTVVTNIAIALAETGRRVLLIDADRRRPRLHEVFRSSNAYGLSEYLTASSAAGLDLKALTQPTVVPGLRILPAGLDRSCSPNLVRNPRMEALLAAARQEFDTVLVDTPPLLALSDARGLGRMADGMALVIRARHTPEHILFTVFERLRQDGIRVLGTILNSWSPDRRFGKAYYEKAGYAAAAYRRD
jgi:succinoglycan biosynthesis transport protein ExoP